MFHKNVFYRNKTIYTSSIHPVPWLGLSHSLWRVTEADLINRRACIGWSEARSQDVEDTTDYVTFWLAMDLKVTDARTDDGSLSNWIP